MTSDQALSQLLEGNQRFVKGELKKVTKAHYNSVKFQKEQSPFACILGCSDSRVPPQLILDQGIGDLFIVRVAGNIVDNLVLGSLEYAVHMLNTPLILVLGHQCCGAVEAAMEQREDSSYLGSITKQIQPVLDKLQNKTDLEAAVRLNALEVASQLSSELIFAPRVEEGSLRIAAAYYNMSSGSLDIL